MTIYFLGGGNMAKAIINGLVREGHTDIHVVNRGKEKRQALVEQYGIEASETLPQLTADDILILAVKPQDLEVACQGIDTHGALVVSIAAGIGVNTLKRYLGGCDRIIRAMPNTPAAVGCGVTGLYADSHISASDKEKITQIMQTSGQVVWLNNEMQLHHITAISGSGPAYVFYLMRALQDAAKQLGFDDKQSQEIVLATFEGGVELAKQSGLDFAELQAQVTSKGGTTYEAIQVFEQKQVNQAIIDGAQANVARSRELAEQFK